MIRTTLNGMTSEHRFESSGLISGENHEVLAFALWGKLGLLIHSRIRNCIQPSMLTNPNIITKWLTRVSPVCQWDIECWFHMNTQPRTISVIYSLWLWWLDKKHLKDMVISATVRKIDTRNREALRVPRSTHNHWLSFSCSQSVERMKMCLTWKIGQILERSATI